VEVAHRPGEGSVRARRSWDKVSGEGAKRSLSTR